MPESSTIQVKSLHIYPIKSLSGIQLSEASATPEGFEWDRRWMLVDEDGRFLSQRELPQLSLFHCLMDKSALHIFYQSDNTSLALDGQMTATRNVSVWESKLKAGLEPEAISQWFSKRLGRKVYLVKLHKKHKRNRTIKKAPFNMDVSFADGYPYLILSEASLSELNRRLEKPVKIDRFRANIIVEGCQVPHEEDDWGDYNIGAVSFRNIKPCPRCVVVTIDQANAVKSSEPLKTLAQYRKEGNEVMFGVNAICIQPGKVAVGGKLILIQ